MVAAIRFSLRTFVIVFTLVGVSLGLYLYRQQLKNPITIPVAHRLKFSDFTVAQPTAILKYRDPALIKEVEQGQIEWRHQWDPPPASNEDTLAAVLDDFNLIHGQEELIREHRDLFAEKAKSFLQDDAKMVDIMHAAKVLNLLGDQSGFDFALLKFLAAYGDDPSQTWWSSHFSSAPTDWLQEQPELLKVLEQIASLHDASISNPMVITPTTVVDEDGVRRNKRATSAAAVLRRVGDPESYLKITRDVLVSDAMGYEVRHAARKLIEFGPTEEDLENILGVFDSRPGIKFEPAGPDLAKMLLKFDFSTTANSEEWEERVEEKVMELAATAAKGEGYRARGVSPKYQCLIAEHGSARCAEYFLTAFRQERTGYVREVLLSAYRRFTSEDKWKEEVVACIEGSRPINGLLPNYLEIKDQPEVESLKQLAAGGTPISAVAAVKLAGKVEDPGTDEVVSLIEAEYNRLGSVEDEAASGGVYGRHAKMLGLLNALAKSDSTRVRELAGQLPDIPRSRSQIDRKWLVDGIDRHVFVDWLNEHFQPVAPLTVQGIESSAKQFFGYELGTQRTNEFALAALGNLSCGNIVNCEMMAGMIGEVGDVVLKMTKGTDFSVRFVEPSLDDQAESYCRFVCGSHTYEFEFLQFDDWYEWTPIVDILNAVAEERELSKRFFVYRANWGNCGRLVLFVEPRTAKQLSEKFGVSPLDGCEFHFPED